MELSATNGPPLIGLELEIRLKPGPTTDAIGFDRNSARKLVNPALFKSYWLRSACPTTELGKSFRLRVEKVKGRDQFAHRVETHSDPSIKVSILEAAEFRRNTVISPRPTNCKIDRAPRPAGAECRPLETPGAVHYFCVCTIEAPPGLRDNVDGAANGIRSINRRRRSSEDFDPLDHRGVEGTSLRNPHEGWLDRSPGFRPVEQACG